ncbi:MAG: RDD family protein [Treponema sp.]|nr:RDD family protein [Treponema sp.]
MEEENKVNEENESQNTVKDFTYPSFMGRAGAYIFDGLILSPVFVLLFFVQGKLYTSESMFYSALIIELMFFIIQNSYNVFFTKRFNGTPGKLLCKFRICREDGMPVTWETAIKRESLYIVLYLFELLLLYKFFFAHRSEADTFMHPIFLFSKTTESIIYTWIYRLISIIDFGKALFSPKRITLHDKIAGTVVVYKPV